MSKLDLIKKIRELHRSLKNLKKIDRYIAAKYHRNCLGLKT